MTDILLYFLDAITPFHLAITLAGTVVGIIIGALDYIVLPQKYRN